MSIRKYPYYLGSILSLLTGIEEYGLVVRVFLGLPTPKNLVIRLRKTGLRFQARGAMDLWSIKETWLDQFYRKFGVEIGDGWSIVDIGAGIGEFTLYAAHGHPKNLIYAFEPFPGSFTLLQNNLKLNQMTGVQAFNDAIGAETGTLRMSLANGEPLQVSTSASADPAQSISVPCLSLKAAFQRLGLARCHLLKLDCEGAEYPILFNAPQSVFEIIDQIIMEYHDRVTAHSHTELIKFLTDKGFHVRAQTNYVHSDLGYLYAYRA
jgi:FkbM family methyltransferase